ncbi:MAG: enoyl-CoA hydratase-related protein [Solirubrobacteraceae bacterium]
MSEHVTVRRDGAVVEIEIDRPPVNALDAAASQALGEAIDAADRDPGVAAVILTGAGDRCFCAGADLNEPDPPSGAAPPDPPGGWGGMLSRHDAVTPVIAAVNGHAVGGGFELALACDLIVAAEQAEFWLPEVALGIAPDPDSLPRLFARLPRTVGMELLLTGRRMTAAEAARRGLACAVAPRGGAAAAARELAQPIAAAPAGSVAEVLRLARG